MTSRPDPMHPRPHDADAPPVSVLVSMYNHERYVETCLDSLRDEGYPGLEVIVLDDGSADGGYRVAERWRGRNPDAFARFTLLRQKNQGIARVLNRLISLASYEYLALVSADDYLLPGGIAARVEALRRNPQWLWVFADNVVVDENGELVHDSSIEGLFGGNRAALANDRTRAFELIARWSVAGSVPLVRREAFDRTRGVGSYDETLFVDDRDMYLRLLARGAVGYVDRPVAAYRVHGQSAAHAHSKRVQTSVTESELKNVKLFSGFARTLIQVKAIRARDTDRMEEARGVRRTVYRGRVSIARRLCDLFLTVNDMRARF